MKKKLSLQIFLPIAVYSISIAQNKLYYSHDFENRVSHIKKENENVAHNFNLQILNSGIKVDSSWCQEYDENSNTWENYSMNTLNYDSDENITEDLTYYWDGTAWTPSFKTSYSYNTNGDVYSIDSYIWDGVSWKNYSQVLYNYDTNGNKTLVTNYSYWIDGIGWSAATKDSTIYNSNSLSDTVFYSHWDYYSFPVWTFNYKESYTYNLNKNTQDYYQYFWSGSEWKLYYKGNYSYDTSNNLIERLGYTYVNANWVEESKSTYTYDQQNNQISSTYYYTDGTNLALSDSSFSSYNNNGQIIEHLLYLGWNGISWNSGSKTQKSFDSDGRIISGFDYYLNGTTWEPSEMDTINYFTNGGVESYSWWWDGTTWISYEHCIANYDMYAGITEKNEDVEDVSLYPNPMDNEAIIQINNLQHAAITLSVFDSQGKKVYQSSTIENTILIDRKSLFSGLYLYQLQDNQGVISNGKLMVK